MAETKPRRRRRRQSPRNTDDLPRMALHVAWGTALAVAYLAGVARSWLIIIMGSFLALLLVLEALRINFRRRPNTDPVGFLARTWARVGRRFMRTSERRGEWVAALASVAGYLAVLVFFDRPVAVAAILTASLGDPVARLVGLRFGTIKLAGYKSLQGTAALMLVAWIVARALGFGWMVALAGAICAAAADMASTIYLGPRVRLDDNLIEPVATALGLWLAMRVLGG